jgi:hypothetical protein
MKEGVDTIEIDPLVTVRREDHTMTIKMVNHNPSESSTNASMLHLAEETIPEDLEEIEVASEEIAVAREVATEEIAVAREVATEEIAMAREADTEEIAVVTEVATEVVIVATNQEDTITSKEMDLLTPFIINPELQLASKTNLTTILQ